MKTKNVISKFLVLLALLAITAGCSPWKVCVERDVVKNGISFETFREYSDGRKVGTLTEDTMIDGWPCKRDFVDFYPDWRLYGLLLFRDCERNGVFMPAGTWVFPDKKGNPGNCIFPYDVEIQGHLCRGGKIEVFTSFYASGKLKFFRTRDPEMIDGVTCKSSIFHGIYLHENGRLWKCKLNEPVRIGGEEYTKGTILVFDLTGDFMKQGTVDDIRY
jgi:hypothetical protein